MASTTGHPRRRRSRGPRSTRCCSTNTPMRFTQPGPLKGVFKALVLVGKALRSLVRPLLRDGQTTASSSEHVSPGRCAYPLASTNAHTAHRRRAGRSLLWAPAEGRGSCKHQSGHDGVDTRTAAVGVMQAPAGAGAFDEWVGAVADGHLHHAPGFATSLARPADDHDQARRRARRRCAHARRRNGRWSAGQRAPAALRPHGSTPSSAPGPTRRDGTTGSPRSTRSSPSIRWHDHVRRRRDEIGRRLPRRNPRGRDWRWNGVPRLVSHPQRAGHSRSARQPDLGDLHRGVHGLQCPARGRGHRDVTPWPSSDGACVLRDSGRSRGAGVGQSAAARTRHH